MNWNIDDIKKSFYTYPDPDKLNILLNSNVKFLSINIFRLAGLLWWVESFDDYIETLPRKASIYQVVDSGTMLNI